jgi:23S rRNA-/tRNA-specific pseudouridylate synthase
LLELKLETGRKNQIRAHCEMVDHPIAGDKKYGANSNPAKRVCLHARYLAFHHPITGKKMEFNSPLPEVFHKIVKPSES